MSVLAAVSVADKPNRLQQPQKSNNDARFITTTMDLLRGCGWYWGSISPEESESVLKEKCSGSFLLRDSSDDHYIFTLSVKTDEDVAHVRINQQKGKFSFGSSGRYDKMIRCGTVVELIETAVENSTNNRLRYFLHPKAGVHAAQSISLTHPVSRFSFVHSLKHAARFEILHYVRADHIDRLPLPANLKLYLKDPKHVAELP